MQRGRKHRLRIESPAPAAFAKAVEPQKLSQGNARHRAVPEPRLPSSDSRKQRGKATPPAPAAFESAPKPLRRTLIRPEPIAAPVQPLRAPLRQQAVPLRKPITGPPANSRRAPKSKIRATSVPKATRPPRFQKDENELREMALRHISYEIKMLRELADALQGKGVGPRTLTNALLESFLIHYRNLYDFFYPEFPSRKRLPHDVAASDYLPDPKQWRKKRPALDRKRVIENRERVNCLLAHLTLRRLKYKNRSWPDRKMTSTIEALIEEFIKELPHQRRPWFRSVIARTQNVPQLQAA